VREQEQEGAGSWFWGEGLWGELRRSQSNPTKCFLFLHSRTEPKRQSFSEPISYPQPQSIDESIKFNCNYVHDDIRIPLPALGIDNNRKNTVSTTVEYGIESRACRLLSPSHPIPRVKGCVAFPDISDYVLMSLGFPLSRLLSPQKSDLNPAIYPHCGIARLLPVISVMSKRPLISFPP
jgi:hypothetical protein